MNAKAADAAINLHIDRLILDGIELSPRDRILLEQSVTDELTRLLTAGGLAAEFQSGRAVPAVPAGTVQLSRDPTRLGNQIARAVYQGIGL